ncbi:MBL fold metallo-hydrolase [Hyphococcus sp.]|uniref:MBL fold metallo-hydrolase n=1 Tax=Hyphococcus sp. TaxID=2038636 RepID=UPI003CCC09B4
MKAIKLISSSLFLAGLTALALQSAYAADDDELSPQFKSGDDVSLTPGHPNHFAAFAPESPEMLARMPEIDPETGLHVSEVKPGLFYVTEGVYQSAFLVTDEGVIVFDAPPSFAHKLPDLIAEHAPGMTIRYLVYSHGHTDHIGGAGVFAGIKGLEVVAHEKVAESIAKSGRPGLLKPTRKYDEQYDVSLGGQIVEFTPASFHAEDADTIIYLPDRKFVIAVDTITPGEVPFMNFGATSDVGAYMTFFDRVLDYDFDHILSGHVSVLGNRDDVVMARDYAFDVRETAGRSMATFFNRFNSVFKAFEYKNANLAYRTAIESVRRDCAKEIIDSWSGKLSVVDVWADSHCQTVILYNIMH